MCVRTLFKFFLNLSLFSVSCSFELNSEVFGDEPLLSISNRVPGENEILHNNDIPYLSSSLPTPDVSQSFAQWVHNSTSADLEISQTSMQQGEEMDLDKDLLNQQCGELREELAVKDRESSVLREEIIKTAEELEEARNRYIWSIHCHIIRCMCYLL